MKLSLTNRLKRLGACNDAIIWSASYGTDFERAWAECERGDWMLWIIGKCTKSEPWSDGRKLLLSCCLDVAEAVKHSWPKDRADKIASAVGVLRAWIGGTASVEQAQQARRDLSNTADAATAAYAAAAVAAVADAAAYAADAADARAQSLKQSADIVRRHFPKPPEE